MLRPHNQVLWYGSQDLDYPSKHIILRISRKYGYPKEQFCTYAPHGPHINGGIVWKTQNDLRTPVKTRLNVVVNLVALETSTSKIDHFQIQVVYRFEQDIFRL
jgi:hypothetical protein